MSRPCCQLKGQGKIFRTLLSSWSRSFHRRCMYDSSCCPNILNGVSVFSSGEDCLRHSYIYLVSRGIVLSSFVILVVHLKGKPVTSELEKRRTSSPMEEEAGVLKSGYVTAAFSPVKTKRVYYAVLGHRALELHENEKKSQRKNRHPRHLIDLSNCFNINRHVSRIIIFLCDLDPLQDYFCSSQFDGRLKYCVAIMTPDETLVLRAETDVMSDEWYEMLMSAVIPARALHLGRPVLLNEFLENFSECAWDVTIVEHPKFRKSIKSSEKLINLCTKDPSLLGPYRLCFYHHTIILCRRGIEPAPADALSQSGIPPFKVTDFVEFPFWLPGAIFFMVMGRSSPCGSGELWALCDCEEVAADVHNKLNKIIEEECEKREKCQMGQPLLHLTSTYHAHRDRLHTHTGLRRVGTAPSKKLTPDELSLKERRAQLRGYKWAADSIQEREKKTRYRLMFPLFCGLIRPRLGKCLRNSRSGQNLLAKKLTVPEVLTRKYHCPHHRQLLNLSLENLEWSILSRHYSSLASSSATEETEDSGGTLRNDLEEVTNRCKTDVEQKIKANIERTHASMSKQLFMPHSESRKAFSTTNENPERGDRADETLCSAAGNTSTNDDFLQATPGEISKDASGDNLEYAAMEMNSWSSGSASHLGLSIGEPQFNFEEVRSYVSDSSDSCYSSMAANGAPRIFIWCITRCTSATAMYWKKLMHPDHGSPAPSSPPSGGILPQSEDIHLSNKPSPSACVSQEDARKRAFL
ncbi:Insulin receptor substrate 1 [Dirofilaria immitis]|nr:Insulin receptor substrate 1 [Dirofilaria immitis]